MAWKKPDPGLTACLRAGLEPYPAQERRMFGAAVFFAGGNLMAGVHQDTILLRLSESDRQELLAARDEVTRFEPMPGRPMREYVALPESLAGNRTFLEEWLARAFAYTAALPAKEPKPGKKKATVRKPNSGPT